MEVEERIDPEAYAQGVRSGDIPACKWVRLAVERHYNDLERDDLVFEDAFAKHIISFFPMCIRHTKGKFAGRRFHLEPWQQFIMWQLFGWHRSDGTRRYKSSYISIPKKNGKTTLAAALSLLFLFALEEASAEVYYAATGSKQARICYNEAARMSKQSPEIAAELRVQRSAIHHQATESIAIPLSRDTNDAMDGINPFFSVVDEYHAHQDTGIVDILKSGSITRENPLQFIITTAGFNFDGPCHKLEKVCQQILERSKENDTQFCIMYGIDEEDDWRDESTWCKANPSMGAVFDVGAIRDEYEAAAVKGGRAEVNFKTKHLNMWVGAAEVWIKDEVFMAAPVIRKNLTKTPCYGGLDIAATSDFTAMSLVFPDGESAHVKTWTWLPEDTAAQFDDGRYDQFIESGDLELTPGNVTDHRMVRKRIKQIADTYDIRMTAYDRYLSIGLIQDLTDDGLALKGMAQTIPTLGPFTAEYERLVLSGKVIHNNNELLRWQMQNVELVYNYEGWYKPNKRDKDRKVDAVVATVMAVGVWQSYEDVKYLPPGTQLVSIMTDKRNESDAI